MPRTGGGDRRGLRGIRRLSRLLLKGAALHPFGGVLRLKALRVGLGVEQFAPQLENRERVVGFLFLGCREVVPEDQDLG